MTTCSARDNVREVSPVPSRFATDCATSRRRSVLTVPSERSAFGGSSSRVPAGNDWRQCHERFRRCRSPKRLISSSTILAMSPQLPGSGLSTSSAPTGCPPTRRPPELIAHQVMKFEPTRLVVSGPEVDRILRREPNEPSAVIARRSTRSLRSRRPAHSQKRVRETVSAIRAGLDYLLAHPMNTFTSTSVS